MKTLDDLLNDINFPEEFKQKEFIKLKTKRCEISGNSTYNCFGTIFRLPEKLQMEFTLTNDHIEREECKYKQAKFNFNILNLN